MALSALRPCLCRSCSVYYSVYSLYYYKSTQYAVAYAYGIERAEDVSVQVLLSLLAFLVQKYVLLY
jgi:hypothetical protein